MDGLRLAALSALSVCWPLDPSSGQAPVAPGVQFDAPRPGPTLLNLGLSTGISTGLAAGTSSPTVGGDFMLLRVHEGGQGGQDLNGDGDVQDSVVHSVSLLSGAATNLGLAASDSGSLDEGGELGSLSVWEVSQGADLNGDGDLSDRVGFAVDPQAGTAVNLGLANASFDTGLGTFLPHAIPSDGRFLFCRVSEKEQGPVDLNGDGDTQDDVYHVYDSASGVITNSMLAIGQQSTWQYPLGGGVVGVSLGEAAMAMDLNGDGDVLDVVGSLLDATTFTGVNLELAGVFRGSSLTGYGVLLVSEQSQGGVDLTGDGDAFDDILHVVDGASRTAFSLGWSSDLNPVVAGEAVAFEVSEHDHPADLNGDGDHLDRVAFTYHFQSATLFASGLAVDGIRGAEASFLCDVAESQQGHADLNGDGDSADDVVHVLDSLRGRSTNLGLAFSGGTEDLKVGGDFAAFSVGESAQGAVDLNADGDVLDRVIRLHVLPTEDSWSSGLSCDKASSSASRVVGSCVAWLVNEGDEGGTDLNADGDLGDLVLHALAPGGSTPKNLALAAWSVGPAFHPPAKAAFVAAHESDQQQDLNGDGDQADLVAHILRP